MKVEREYNYDLLRVISMIAVIIIHVSATWVSGFGEYVADGGEVNELVNPFMSCVYNTISRFAVPCFIMLTGAFVLDDNRTANYQEFYRKKVVKIGLPTIIFSVLYVLYRIPLCFVGEQSGLADLITLIKDIIKGSPFYHMWYLYMLIGLYLMSPVVVRFKDSISYENFKKVAFIFLVLASISRWTTGKVRLNWDVGQSFEYLGYFMVGYVIRKDLQKNNFRGILLIMFGMIIEIITAFVQYEMQIVNGIAEAELKFGIVSPYSPTIVLASLLIFAGFTKLQIRCNRQIEKLAGMSFIIYLFHAGVWDFFRKLIHLIKGKDYIVSLNNIYWIPVFVVMVFVISVLLAIIYNKLELHFFQKEHKR